MYATLKRPLMVLCSSETRPFRKTEEKTSEIFERKVLRKIFEPRKNDRTGKLRKRKLQDLLQRPNITKEFSVGRL